MQRLGLEWLFRLWTEPRRLWRRYLFLNPAYVSLLALQAAKLRGFQSDGVPPSTQLNYG
jgi:UDP-N-acetyl-D-mannosaminuronic acid transferase (WecB/TagA/CpsF family)